MKIESNYTDNKKLILFQEVDSILRDSLHTIHGRHTRNMFGLYWHEISDDFSYLIKNGYIDSNLNPTDTDGVLIYPNFSKCSPDRMRFMWDNFYFLYMSHKSHNIKWIKGYKKPSLLYLRGADYDLGLEKTGGGAAIGNIPTLNDNSFYSRISDVLLEHFNVIKALSPSDLIMVWHAMGHWLAYKGNALREVGQFARGLNAGLYLNPSSWKKKIKEAISNASVYLVYVSNQSNGLMYELETLLETGVEENTILVLDKNRFTARKSYFDLQAKLKKENGNNLYHSIMKDVSAVKNKEEFEKLIKRFPNRIQLEDVHENSEKILEDLRRVTKKIEVDYKEIAFEFGINLDSVDSEKIETLRIYVKSLVEKYFVMQNTLNLPAVLFFLEMDIFFNVLDNRVCESAASTARYGLLADRIKECLMVESPEMLSKMSEHLTQHGNMACNIALDAYSAGEWNDYSDRREIANQFIDSMTIESIQHLTNLIKQSKARSMTNKRESSKKTIDPDDYLKLLKAMYE